MPIMKCPRCELNYILDGGALCTVCRREVRGEQTEDETVEMCSECGENPAVPGGELCVQCLKEMNRPVTPSVDDDQISVEEVTQNMDTVSTMDEIVIDDPNADEVSFAEDSEFAGEDGDEDSDEEDDDEAVGSRSRVRRMHSPVAELTRSGYSVVDESDLG